MIKKRKANADSAHIGLTTPDLESRQKQNLIERLRKEYRNSGAKVKVIFQCCFCRLWHLSEFTNCRVHWNPVELNLGVFRVCRSCNSLLSRMSVALRWVDEILPAQEVTEI